MLKECFELCCDKLGIPPAELDMVFSGDLLNQCVGSAFALKNTGVPHFGLYGACSTMGESMTLAAMALDGGFADRVCAARTFARPSGNTAFLSNTADSARLPRSGLSRDLAP